MDRTHSSAIRIIGDWAINHQQHILHKHNKQEKLDLNQYATLMLLAEHHGHPVSKQVLMDNIWQGKIVTEDSIYVTINGLRKALGDNAKHPQYIRTVSGKGYQLIANVAHQTTPFPNLRYWLACLLLAIVITVVLIWQQNVTSTASMPKNDTLLSPQATDHFQRANYLMTLWPPKKEQAEQLYQQVIQRHPEFTEAYVKLSAAMMYRIFDNDLSVYQQRDTLLHQLNYALTLTPNNKQAHLLLGNLHFLILHDFPKANHHFERSLETADSYYFYTQFLLAMGEFEQAKQHLATYIRLHPQGYSGEGAAWIYTMAGEYQQAKTELDKLAEFATEQSYYHVSRQALYELTGNNDQAFEKLKQLMIRAGYQDQEIESINQAYRQSNLPGAYAWLAFSDKKQLNIGQYTPPLSLARYAVSAGYHNEAIEFLEQGLVQRKIELLWVAVDPKYRPLHHDQRFLAILDKLKLPSNLKAVKNN